MKKFVSLFLVLFMLIPMMTIGIHATTETASSTVDDAMFVHYDFSEDSYYTAGTVPVFKNLARTNGQNASQGRLIPNSSELINCILPPRLRFQDRFRPCQRRNRETRQGDRGIPFHCRGDRIAKEASEEYLRNSNRSACLKGACRLRHRQPRKIPSDTHR